MTDDKPNWPTEAEVRASFPTPPGFDAYIEVISGLRGEIYTIRDEAPGPLDWLFGWAIRRLEK